MSDDDSENMLSSFAAFEINIGSAVVACVGLAMAVSILIAAGVVFAHKSARRHIDRVSFRLLLWSMGAEIVYGISYLCMYLSPTQYQPPLPDNIEAYCSAWMYFNLGSMQCVNWLTTAIALNLMLTITFEQDPIRQKLERWYVAGSFVLGFGVPIVPTALGHFGMDPYYDLCYFTAVDLNQRYLQFILDLYGWQLLSALLACISVITTMVTLHRQGKITRKASEGGAALMLGEGTFDDRREYGAASYLRRFWAKIRTRRANAALTHQLDSRLWSIAMKIALYPVTLVVLNVLATFTEFYLATVAPNFDSRTWPLYCVYCLVYGTRGIFFAILALIVDPCLRKGLRCVWRLHLKHGRSSEWTQHELNEVSTFAAFLASSDPHESRFMGQATSDLPSPDEKDSIISLSEVPAVFVAYPSKPAGDRNVQSDLCDEATPVVDLQIRFEAGRRMMDVGVGPTEAQAPGDEDRALDEVVSRM